MTFIFQRSLSANFVSFLAFMIIGLCLEMNARARDIRKRSAESTAMDPGQLPGSHVMDATDDRLMREAFHGSASSTTDMRSRSLISNTHLDIRQVNNARIFIPVWLEYIQPVWQYVLFEYHNGQWNDDSNDMEMKQNDEIAVNKFSNSNTDETDTNTNSEDGFKGPSTYKERKTDLIESQPVIDNNVLQTEAAHSDIVLENETDEQNEDTNASEHLNKDLATRLLGHLGTGDNVDRTDEYKSKDTDKSYGILDETIGQSGSIVNDLSKLARQLWLVTKYTQVDNGDYNLESKLPYLDDASVVDNSMKDIENSGIAEKDANLLEQEHDTSVMNGQSSEHENDDAMQSNAPHDIAMLGNPQISSNVEANVDLSKDVANKPTEKDVSETQRVDETLQITNHQKDDSTDTSADFIPMHDNMDTVTNNDQMRAVRTFAQGFVVPGSAGTIGLNMPSLTNSFSVFDTDDENRDRTPDQSQASVFSQTRFNGEINEFNTVGSFDAGNESDS